MTDKIVSLPAHTNMTVEQCLQLSTRESGADGWQDVMILAYDAEDKLVVRSSHMSRKDALWMLMAAADHARGID